MSPVDLAVATTNAGKLAEFRRILSNTPIVNVRGLQDFGRPVPSVEEDGDTFEANAMKKARAYAEFTGVLTVADDSGLEVDVLGGEPGVFSARYAREGASDGENVSKLIRRMAGVPEPARWARFRCVLALVDPREQPHFEHMESATVEGHIALAPRGDGGFGYDPVFVSEGMNKTMAQLDSEAKDRISHRGIAVAKLANFLRQYLTGQRLG